MNSPSATSSDSSSTAVTDPNRFVTPANVTLDTLLNLGRWTTRNLAARTAEPLSRGSQSPRERAGSTFHR
jgi:hypothetical protein